MKNALRRVLICLISSSTYGEDFPMESVGFVSHGDTLSGTIVFRYQKEAYDERGAGQSQGTYESAHSVSESNINLPSDDIPGLWLFGGGDGRVPVDLSIDRLMAAGHPYNYVLFSQLGRSNMTETLSVATDWVNGLSSKAGTAETSPLNPPSYKLIR